MSLLDSNSQPAFVDGHWQVSTFLGDMSSIVNHQVTHLFAGANQKILRRTSGNALLDDHLTSSITSYSPLQATSGCVITNTRLILELMNI